MSDQRAMDWRNGYGSGQGPPRDYHNQPPNGPYHPRQYAAHPEYTSTPEYTAQQHPPQHPLQQYPVQQHPSQQYAIQQQSAQQQASQQPQYNPQYNHTAPRVGGPRIGGSQMEPLRRDNNGQVNTLARPSVPRMPPARGPYEQIALTQYGRKYELLVVQQPQRARMCGFGDKDRRPITPPPCVRLLVTDELTGKEILANDIDYSMFVINVDLWNSDGNSEVNLVRHTTVTPSVINAALLSYNEPKPVWAPIKPGTEDQVRQQLPGFNPSLHQTPTVNPYANASGVDQNAAAFYNHGQTPTQRLPPSSGGRESERQPYGAMTGAQTPSQGRGSQQLTSPNSDESEQKPRQQLAGHPQPTGMFTRNLIGSLATNAFSLTDTEERIGIWFVLQDLSVRTEGTFRLRFSFVNVGAVAPHHHATQPPDPSSNMSHSNINAGKAPILAQCFSDVFDVYSAKKFPGVVESTPLSKCFATQGIKIPIRKDGAGDKKKTGGGEEEDDD